MSRSGFVSALQAVLAECHDFTLFLPSGLYSISVTCTTLLCFLLRQCHDLAFCPQAVLAECHDLAFCPEAALAMSRPCFVSAPRLYSLSVTNWPCFCPPKCTRWVSRPCFISAFRLYSLSVTCTTLLCFLLRQCHDLAFCPRLYSLSVTTLLSALRLHSLCHDLALFLPQAVLTECHELALFLPSKMYSLSITTLLYFCLQAVLAECHDLAVCPEAAFAMSWPCFVSAPGCTHWVSRTGLVSALQNVLAEFHDLALCPPRCTCWVLRPCFISAFRLYSLSVTCTTLLCFLLRLCHDLAFCPQAVLAECHDVALLSFNVTWTTLLCFCPQAILAECHDLAFLIAQCHVHDLALFLPSGCTR